MDADTDPKTTKSTIKRFRIGLNVLVQLVLLLVIVGIVNSLSCRKFTQWDQTASKRYSLSEQTHKILNNLSRDLYLTVAFSRSSDVYPYTQRMIDLYKKAAGNRLHVQWIDPLRDPAAVAELQNQDPNLAFDENKILVSRTETLGATGEGASTERPYQVVTEQDMFQRAENLMFRDGRSKRGNVTTYRLERALTSTLLAATEERQQVVYIISSKGGMRTVEGKTAGGHLMLEGGLRQNLKVLPLPFTKNSVVPDDASAVMIISPRSDFSGSELKEIFDAYWEKRKGGLVLLLNPRYYENLPNLRNYLATNYGVSWENNRVLSVKSRGGQNVTVYEPPSWFKEGSPITQSLTGRQTTLPFQSSTLNIHVAGDQNDPLAPRATDKKVLLAADYFLDGFWKEPNYLDPNPIAEAKETADIDLAVSVEIGAGINQDLRLNSSRMVVVGNGNLMDPDQRERERVEFILNSINWAIDREQVVAGIETQQAGNFQITIGDRPYAKLEWMSLRILPGTVFLIGLSVAYFRRR